MAGEIEPLGPQRSIISGRPGSDSKLMYWMHLPKENHGKICKPNRTQDEKTNHNVNERPEHQCTVGFLRKGMKRFLDMKTFV